MKIQHTTSDNGKSSLVICSSPIDKDSSLAFSTFIDTIISRGATSAVVDLSGAGYVESDGLTAVVNAHRRFRDIQGLMILTGLSREMKSVFRMLGLSSELVTAETGDDARDMIKRSGGGAFKKTPLDETSPLEPAGEDLKKDNSSVIPGETVLQEGETVFSQPLIVECEECCAFVRVHSSGAFLCPSCHAQFSVERDGTVIF